MSVSTAASASRSSEIQPEVGSGRSSMVIPDDMLYEVVDGQIREKIMGAREIHIATLLVEYLAPFLRSNRLGQLFGEMIFRIDQPKDLQRRPDVAFVSSEKWPVNRLAPSVPAWDMVPDLAVEVVSPTNSAVEVLKKIHEDFAAGVSMVWVIYSEQKNIHIYSSPTDIRALQIGDDLDGRDLTPGFRLPLAALFQDERE